MGSGPDTRFRGVSFLDAARFFRYDSDMNSLKNPFLIAGTVALVILVGLAWNYTEAIKAKNEVESKKIESDERLKSQELRQKQEEAVQRREREEKEFDAKRKEDCLAIYKVEGAKWNNVNGWRYDEEEDECFIRYKDQKPKTDAQCDESYPLRGEDGPIPYNFHQNILCKDGNFENTF